MKKKTAFLKTATARTAATDREWGTRCLLGESADLLASAKPLEDAIVVHGARERFGPFLEIAQLRSALTVLDAYDGTPGLARAWSPASSGKGFEMYPTRDQIRTLYDAGFTIVLEEVDRYVPELRPLCRKLERDLGVATGKVYVEAFCAQEGGKARPHFDHSFTFNCQVDGTKTWWLAKNEAVRFPPAGMFLGRPVGPELEHVINGPMLAAMPLAKSEKVVAEPGTVVFLPPGVLHETRTETASFAVLFALEADTVADLVSTRVRRRLETIAEIRAPRLGPQLVGADLSHEAAVVASQLRQMADEIERDHRHAWMPSSRGKANLRLVPGLVAEPRGDRELLLTTTATNKTRMLVLEPEMVRILGWASKRREEQPFDLVEVTREHASIDVGVLTRCIERLVGSGLIVEQQKEKTG